MRSTKHEIVLSNVNMYPSLVSEFSGSIVEYATREQAQDAVAPPSNLFGGIRYHGCGRLASLSILYFW